MGLESVCLGFLWSQAKFQKLKKNDFYAGKKDVNNNKDII